MNASSSVEAEIRHWVDGFRAKDPAVLESFSRQPGALAVGTDPREWWPGYDRFQEVGRAQLASMPELTLDVQQISAHEEGSVGWGIADTVLTFSGAKPLAARITVVCHREEGAWKAVLWQLAFGVPNEDIFPSELPS